MPKVEELVLGEEVIEVPLNELSAEAPDRNQKEFKQAGGISELAANMEELGQITPIVITTKKYDGKHEILAGKRRFHAAQKANFKTLKAVILDGDDALQAIALIADNLHNSKPDPFLQAKMLAFLMKNDPESFPDQKTLADKLGKSSKFVSWRLKLLELPADLKKQVRAGTLPPHVALEGLAKTNKESKKAKKESVKKAKKVGKKSTGVGRPRKVKVENKKPDYVKFPRVNLTLKDGTDYCHSISAKISKNNFLISIELPIAEINRVGVSSAVVNEIKRIGDKQLTAQIKQYQKTHF